MGQAAVRIVPVKGDRYIQVVARQGGKVKVLRSFGSAEVQENYLRAHLFADAYYTMRKLLEALDREENVDRDSFYTVFGDIVGKFNIDEAIRELAPNS